MQTNKRSLAWFLWPTWVAFPLQLLTEAAYELVSDLGIMSLALGFPDPRSSKVAFEIDLLPVCFGFFAAIMGWVCVEQARRRAIRGSHPVVALSFIPLSLGTFFYPYYSCGADLLTVGKYLFWGQEPLPFGPMDFDLGMAGCCVGFGNWKIVAVTWVLLALFCLTAAIFARWIKVLATRIWPTSPQVGFRTLRMPGPIAHSVGWFSHLIGRLTKAAATKPSILFLYSVFPLGFSLAWDSFMAGPSRRVHALLRFELASVVEFSVPVHAGSLFLAFLTLPMALVWVEFLKASFIAYRHRFRYTHLVLGQVLLSVSTASFWGLFAIDPGDSHLTVCAVAKVLLWSVVSLPLLQFWWLQWRSHLN